MSEIDRKFIRLTRYDNDEEIYIEARNILGIYRNPSNIFTIVTTNDAVEMVAVTERPSAVIEYMRELVEHE